MNSAQHDMKTNEKEKNLTKEEQDSSIHNFLSRHIPPQVSTTKKLCYRHRPDLIKKRMPDAFDFNMVQRQMEELGTNDRAAITHIWSLFSAAPADQRMLILKGLLSTCCMPQLSFLHDEIKPLLRIDFVSILPHEVSLQIFSYMDAKSLCSAAQVSRAWCFLANDDGLWHRMCEQHIDKKCTKCGWGLPLLDKKRQTVRKRSLSTTRLSPTTPQSGSSSSPAVTVPLGNTPLRTPCGPITSQDDSTTPTNGNNDSNKRLKVGSTSSSFDSFAADDTSLQPPLSSSKTTAPAVVRRRPWKEVYSERLVVERNWRNNRYNVQLLSGHTDGVMCVQFCDAGNVVMTGSYDKTIRIWNLETGELIRILKGHTRCVRALQFDEAKLVTGAMDHTLKIWNWHTGECIRTLEGHTGGVLSLHFDCRLMASGSIDHTIRIWNFQAGECCTLTGHTEWVNSVRLCQKDMLVSGSDDSTVRLWDLQSRSCIRVFNGHVGQVQIALPSPKGFTHRRLLDEEVTIDTMQRRSNGFRPGCETTTTTARSTGKSTSSSSSTSSPSSSSQSNSAVFSDAPLIMTGSLDNTVKQWDLNSGACVRTLFGHVEGVWGLAYDTLRVVSGSHDKTIRVWDMDSGRCMHALEGHNGPVTAIALSDTKIISCSDDGDVRIWDYGVH